MQPQKLDVEMRVPSLYYTSNYFGTWAMWDFALHPPLGAACHSRAHTLPILIFLGRTQPRKLVIEVRTKQTKGIISVHWKR